MTTSTSPVAASRNRFSPFRPSRDDALMQSADDLVQAVHLGAVKERRVAELAHGQQRQLEIALALAGAPRFILFDEPAAGLSPTERAELVDILTALPSHIGYIIIEHDMDVALRVVESVTMMTTAASSRKGRRRPSSPTPRCRSFISEATMADMRRAAPILRGQGSRRPPRSSHALQGVDLTLETGVLSVVGRNGMGKTTLCKTIMGRACHRRFRPHRRRGYPVAATGADRPPRRRLRAARAASVAWRPR